MELDFTIAHKKCADHHHADFLSRLLTASPTVEEEDEEEIPTFNDNGEYKRVAKETAMKKLRLLNATTMISTNHSHFKNEARLNSTTSS